MKRGQPEPGPPAGPPSRVVGAGPELEAEAMGWGEDRCAPSWVVGTGLQSACPPGPGASTSRTAAFRAEPRFGCVVRPGRRESASTQHWDQMARAACPLVPPTVTVSLTRVGFKVFPVSAWRLISSEVCLCTLESGPLAGWCLPTADGFLHPPGCPAPRFPHPVARAQWLHLLRAALGYSSALGPGRALGGPGTGPGPAVVLVPPSLSCGSPQCDLFSTHSAPFGVPWRSHRLWHRPFPCRTVW